MVLEVCVENVESALSAVRGGARRLEVCSCLSLGGLTPSLELFLGVKQCVTPDCTVFVMIRPKPGESYVYNNLDLQLMVESIKMFKESAADGFVFGCLRENKTVDEESCAKLLEAVGSLPSTFHRAFDVVVDPIHSLTKLMNLGFSRILTSGQKENAFAGRHLIRELVLQCEKSDSGLIIVAGGGITPSNLEEILSATKVKEYHSSARGETVLPHLQQEQQSLIYVTDESVVRSLVEIGKSFNC